MGRDERAESIDVTWADGKVERFEGDTAKGSTLLLKRGSGMAEAVTLAKANLPDPLTKAQIFARSLKIEIGKPMPDFAVKTLAGRASTMQKQLRPGRSTLINIWATWCIPCAKEMPEIQSIRAALAARGIDVLGLNVDAEKDADIHGYLTRKRVTYPIIIGGVAAIEQIYLTDELSVPLSIVVDDKGIVTDLIPGWSAETRQKFAALAGKASAAASGPAPAIK